jgi:hypothetical protein
VAEGWDVDIVFERDFQNGLAGSRADLMIVDDECFDAHILGHANTSFSSATGA